MAPLSAVVESPALALVVFSLDGQPYALHLSAVQSAIPMVAVSPLPEAPAIVLGVINLHGMVLPVMDLRRRLGLVPRECGLTTHLLVARTELRWLVLPVDEVLGVREVARTTVLKPEVVLGELAHVSGIVALSDGLLFIHDLNGFLSLDEGRQLTEAMEEMAE